MARMYEGRKWAQVKLSKSKSEFPVRVHIGEGGRCPARRRGRAGFVFDGEEATEGDAGGADAGDEAEAVGAVSRADEEKVRDRFGGGTVRAARRGSEVEAVKVRIEPDVPGA